MTGIRLPSQSERSTGGFDAVTTSVVTSDPGDVDIKPEAEFSAYVHNRISIKDVFTKVVHDRRMPLHSTQYVSLIK